MITGKFPALRLRRNRKTDWSRRLIEENNLTKEFYLYYPNYQTKTGTFRWDFIAQDKNDEYSLSTSHEVFIQ